MRQGMMDETGCELKRLGDFVYAHMMRQGMMNGTGCEIVSAGVVNWR